MNRPLKSDRKDYKEHLGRPGTVIHIFFIFCIQLSEIGHQTDFFQDLESR